MLSIANEGRLIELAGKLQKAGIPHTLIREQDPPFDGQFTAIGIVPLRDRKRVKKIVSELPLLGSERCCNNGSVGQTETQAPCASSSEAEHQE